MSLFTSLVENRTVVLSRINAELLEEGLPAQKATEKAFITPNGVVWHEIVDPESHVLSYATSHPFNHRNVTVVQETSEALDFDNDIR